SASGEFRNLRRACAWCKPWRSGSWVARNKPATCCVLCSTLLRQNQQRHRAARPATTLWESCCSPDWGKRVMKHRQACVSVIQAASTCSQLLSAEKPPPCRCYLPHAGTQSLRPNPLCGKSFPEPKPCFLVPGALGTHAAHNA